MENTKTTKQNWKQLKIFFNNGLININQLEDYYEDLIIKWFEYKFIYGYKISEDGNKTVKFNKTLTKIDNEYNSILKYNSTSV